MSEVRRYEFDENGVCYHQPDGPFVSYDDYARLKADAQVILKHLDEASADCARLKAEVEELRLENGAFKRTVNEASAHYDNRLADIALLKAEVERLRKAGDAMANICDNSEAPGSYFAVQAWNAAKEGKQP